MVKMVKKVMQIFNSRVESGGMKEEEKNKRDMKVYHGTILTVDAKNNVYQYLVEDAGRIVYVGDDINDVELLSTVGYPCCPPNARPEVLAIPCIRVLHTPGGQGTIREIADEILKKS